LRWWKYGVLVRKHLGKPLGRLFAECTGLHFRTCWAAAPTDARTSRLRPGPCPTGSRRLGMPRPAGEDCRACRLRHLGLAAKSMHGHGFTCALGFRNFWCPIRVRGETLGYVCLQALAERHSRLPAGAGRSAARPRRAGARFVDPRHFARAARLLEHVVDHVETASLGDLRRDELSEARGMLGFLESSQLRSGNDLAGALPAAGPNRGTARRESRPERIARSLLDRIALDYGQPITLRRCARDLNLNAAYLSAIFSRVVGLPFKSYLTQLRLEKAKLLLGDPAWSATQVAYTVGYASENRFRSAFKKATGAAPTLWRETMRVNPSPAPIAAG
jgi:AraC-like DNA-binding protein